MEISKPIPINDLSSDSHLYDVQRSSNLIDSSSHEWEKLEMALWEDYPEEMNRVKENTVRHNYNDKR